LIHRSLLAAVALMSVAACAPETAAPAPLLLPPAAAADFEAAIARFEARDRRSPEALNARLEYADFLSGSDGGDCGKRLDTASAQLDPVSAQPALDVLLPLGRAKLQNAEYKIHAARADCDLSHRQDETMKALEAARAAVGLFRDALDYQSAAIMQYNAAVAQHDLGDGDAAITALQAAIAMDREFGFRDDAQDNTKLLLQWQGQDDSDTNVADKMKDFPARTADFTFDWSESEADVAIDARETSLAAGQTIESTGTILLKRHVRQELHTFAVSYDPGTPTVGLGDWPADHDALKHLTVYLLSSALLGAPKIQVYHNGNFEYVRDARDLGQALLADVTARTGEPVKGDEDGPSRALAQDLKTVFSPTSVQAHAAETYNLETGTWAGAKLEQGVWHQMTAPLFLPAMGMGQFLVEHDIAFAYTRPVPCTPGGTLPDCAEIVVHATPQATDLDLARALVARSFHLPDSKALHHWSTTDLRLVVKPGTLVPYVTDIRRHWYISIDGGRGEPLISSERVVTVSTYQ
jgi:tetratricopeptide (TPR) repeat protein